MNHINVLPGNKLIEVEDGANLRTALNSAGYKIKSKCGGCASCADCVVVIKEGDKNISDISFEEKQLLGNVFHITQERLSCQVEVFGNIVVDVSAHIEKKAVKTNRRTREESIKIVQERKEKAKEKNNIVREGGKKRPKAFKTKEQE